MGQAQSNEVHARGDVGFLPSFHLMKILPGDLQRLFLPHHLAARCKIYEGASVELLDCLDRQYNVQVNKSLLSYYLAQGWVEFLSGIGANCCDSMLFEFKHSRQSKVFLFGPDGVQKFPKLEEHHVQVLMRPSSSGSRWPEAVSSQTAIKAGPCTKPAYLEITGNQSPPNEAACWQVFGGTVYNASGSYIDETMHEYIEDLRENLKPKVPLYYCKISDHDVIGSMKFHRGYTMAHIKPLMGRAWDQIVYLACGSAELLPVKLAVGFDSRATISDGWDEFVVKHTLLGGAECIFQFDKLGCHITLRVHIVPKITG